MSLGNCWVRGICGKAVVRGREYGEVYKALDKGSGMYVAVKKVKLLASEKGLPFESELLMKCSSPFIVRYNGVIREENELWVPLCKKGLMK